MVASVQQDKIRQRSRQARAEDYGAGSDRGREDAVDVVRGTGAVSFAGEGRFNLRVKGERDCIMSNNERSADYSRINMRSGGATPDTGFENQSPRQGGGECWVGQRRKTQQSFAFRSVPTLRNKMSVRGSLELLGQETP